MGVFIFNKISVNLINDYSHNDYKNNHSYKPEVFNEIL